MTMENHFLRIRANIAVWRLGGWLGRERWTDSSLQLHCCIIVSPDIRRWWINPYCSCFYQYYRILIVWCNLMSLNCKITPSPPPPIPPTKKIILGSALVWLVWKYICTMKNCCKGCSLCPNWFRNHSNTTVCPCKHNLLINRCIGTVQLIINIDFSYHLFVNCTYCYYFDDVLTFYLSSSFLKLNHIIDIVY